MDDLGFFFVLCGGGGGGGGDCAEEGVIELGLYMPNWEKKLRIWIQQKKKIWYKRT